MGTLKVQDPPGSGNWVPVLPSVTGGLAFVARDWYNGIWGNSSLANGSSGNLTAVFTPTASRPQADLVFVKWDFNAQAGGNQQVGYTLSASVAGGAYFPIGAMSTHNNGNVSPQLGGTLTGWVPITPGQTISFRVSIDVAAGGFAVNFGLANVSSEFFASTGGGGSLSTPEPDWGAYTNDQASPGSATITGTAIKLPFATAQFKGAGVRPDGASGLQVAKAGVYRLQADITVNSSNAGWLIGEIRIFRAGSQIRVFSIVSGNNTTGGFAEWTVHAITDLLAGDIAYVYATTSAAGTNNFDSRSQFTIHQIATTGASSGELTAGYRGITAQSIPNGTTTTVSLEATPDHTSGGISIASNIVTLATAGVYQFQGSVAYNLMAAARVLLRIEGWSGADPAVGSGTILAANDISNVVNNYPGLLCMGQAFLPAGYRLRLITYQSSGGAAPLVPSSEPAKLNIRKVSQGGQAQDTGWLLPGAGGGTFNTGWGQFGGGYEAFVVKRIGTEVIGRGMVTRSSGSSTTILTLPAGFWPSKATVRLSRSNATPDSIFIDNTTGNIIVSNTVVPVNGQPYLLDFRYDTTQP